MENEILRIYLGELETQSIMAINAAKPLDEIMASYYYVEDLTAENKNYLHKNTFRVIHSFLTHLSNVSRLIWPPAISPRQNCFCGKPKANGLVCNTCVARDRSAAILKALELQGQEHVLRERTLRDHLEHFDERIDHWTQNTKMKCYVQDYIGPKDGFYGIDQADMMRQYDPTTGDFTFRGETYSLPMLFEGAKDIRARAQAALVR
ncbi:hypothetical protein [Pseudomonas mediterranea]|uniref:hypothetical protein n=1 Tax=Pseudomonas mediterranea TaxID=183795 RepID=UPI0006D89090|nr:hypothetical protein [Pseudomonas mediterranea]